MTLDYQEFWDLSSSVLSSSSYRFSVAFRSRDWETKKQWFPLNYFCVNLPKISSGETQWWVIFSVHIEATILSFISYWYERGHVVIESRFPQHVRFSTLLNSQYEVLCRHFFIYFLFAVFQPWSFLRTWPAALRQLLSYFFTQILGGVCVICTEVRCFNKKCEL